MKKKLIALFLLLAILPAFAAPSATSFKDVPKDSWFYNQVNFCVERGLFSGTSATEFAPVMPMTRGMLVTVLGRYEKPNIAGFNNAFSDVPRGSYYEQYIAWAHGQGIVNGKSAASFAPNDEISRQDLCTIFVRYLEGKGHALSERAGKFSDDSGIAPYAKSAVYKLANVGIVNGYTDGSFAPMGSAARAEVATIFFNLITWIEGNASTPQPTATPAPTLEPGKLQISFLDVGQGDSIFAILPNGQSMLIDAGEQKNSAKIAQYIKDFGVSRLDYVIATHPHADHIGGMADIIREFEIGNFWMPNITHTTRTFENMLDALGAKDLKVNIAKSGATLFDFGELKAQFIAPKSDSYANLNNYSAALMLEFKDARFLFMGDAEKESEAEILVSGISISADVLKVGHHGSNTSSTANFIEKVLPKYAIICVGAGNSYGHPTAATLNTLNRWNVEVFRTDTHGTIVVRSDGVDIEIM